MAYPDNSIIEKIPAQNPTAHEALTSVADGFNTEQELSSSQNRLIHATDNNQTGDLNKKEIFVSNKKSEETVTESPNSGAGYPLPSIDRQNTNDGEVKGKQDIDIQTAEFSMEILKRKIGGKSIPPRVDNITLV
ncbi:MAG: hypothetical protein ACOX6Q_03240 [Candidatus Dojkabacteria bacterium]|jgi:hypothetical protein